MGLSLKQYSIVIGAGALIFGAGCPAEGDDVRPPVDQLFFPTSAEVAPDESVLLVANANSELRYDSGAINVIDLDVVDAIAASWADGAAPEGRDCNADINLPFILECNEQEVMVPGSGVRIGNFATDLGIQELASGAHRVFAAVRGDPSVTWADLDDAGTLDCGGSGAFPLCDDDHRLSILRGDLELPGLAAEPFNVFVDSGNEYVAVTHLTDGRVSLVDAPADGSVPLLADLIGGLFAPDPSTGVRGAVGVAGRRPGDPSDLLYVTSRSEDRVQMLYVHRPMDASLFPTFVASEYFFLDGVNPGSDARGIAFSADGDRAHIVNREPAMLITLDTSLDASGFPRNVQQSAVEICREAANVVVADLGFGERAYVSCFNAGEIWVIDVDQADVESVITIGRGPADVAVSPTRQKLYVANFLEDTVAVVDLTPGAATENRMVVRLGRPRQAGGN